MGRFSEDTPERISGGAGGANSHTRHRTNRHAHGRAASLLVRRCHWSHVSSCRRKECIITQVMRIRTRTLSLLACATPGGSTRERGERSGGGGGLGPDSKAEGMCQQTLLHGQSLAHAAVYRCWTSPSPSRERSAPKKPLLFSILQGSVRRIDPKASVRSPFRSHRLLLAPSEVSSTVSCAIEILDSAEPWRTKPSARKSAVGVLRQQGRCRNCYHGLHRRGGTW